MRQNICVAALAISAFVVLSGAIVGTSRANAAQAGSTAAPVEPITLSGEYYFYAMPEADEGSICGERHWFNADGTEIVASGEEIVVKHFRVERSDRWATLYESVLSTNGKPDCLGNKYANYPATEQRYGLYRAMNGGIVLTRLRTMSNGTPVGELIGRYVQSHDGMAAPQGPNVVIPPPPNSPSATILTSTAPGGQFNRPVPQGGAHQCQGYYPPDAEYASRGGITLLVFAITPEGSVANLKVSKSSGQADLDDAAMACVKPWKYSPVSIEGKIAAVPWVAKVTWQPNLADTSYQTDLRVLRRNAWKCLWSSAAARALPQQFAGWLKVHVLYSAQSTPRKVEIAISSGVQGIDAAALACVRPSPALANLEKDRGDFPDASIALAFWHPGAFVEPDNLFDAVKAGDVTRVNALIAAGADVNAKDYQGENTALHWAARKSNLEIMKILLAHGADARARDFHGFTPLHNAAAWGSKECVELLLAHGADASDAKNGGLVSPIHWAVSNGREQVIALLLDHGADINARQLSGDTPLHEAARLSANGITQDFTISTKVEVPDTHKDDQASSTPDNGDTDMVAFLLRHGADANAKNNKKVTPLHGAAWTGHKGVVELLLAHGADVNAKNDAGDTPLRYAESKGHNDIVALLRQHGGRE